jgi:lipopolysaccharide transport system permease protein
MEAGQPTIERVIEPPKGWSLPDLRELWQHRDLVYFLARRDIAVRYKQSLAGASWAVLQPVLLAAVFTVVFDVLAKVEAPEGIPYALFVVSGMVMWLAFATAVQHSSESTVTSADLISKVYFPRLVIPLATTIPPLMDFAIGFAVVVVMTLAFGIVPGPEILLVPVALVFAWLTALGVGLLTSAANVKYRDIHLLVPFCILVGLFITPIVYPFELVSPQLQPFYSVNPMVGVLEAYRWMLLGVEPTLYTLAVPVVVSPLLVVAGAMYFHRAERNFADLI